MLDTSLHQPRTSQRFQSLMELYEENYRLIRLLVPALSKMNQDLYVSQARNALALELFDIRQDKYTTTFKLTYRFNSVEGHELEPDLTLRLYHDARTCEVLSGLLPGIDEKYSRRTRTLDESYSLNRFLNKWLAYCLRQGHGFSAKSSADIEKQLRKAAAAVVNT